MLASRYGIISEDVLKTTCDAHQLCIISVLPHILDTGRCTSKQSPVGICPFKPAIAFNLFNCLTNRSLGEEFLPGCHVKNG
ncbi:UNVERIFIED_CONTAM: hypothetical protein H355_008147 [Colinus virginianus]|nr:hypothetical protein H355_008147 [Colinus virginianus]